MCKTTFKTLIHSVRANDDYKQVGVYCTTSMYHVLAAYSVLYCTGFEVLCTCMSDSIILLVLPVLYWQSGTHAISLTLILVCLVLVLVMLVFYWSVWHSYWFNDPFLQYVVQPKTRADGQEVSLGEARR